MPPSVKTDSTITRRPYVYLSSPHLSGDEGALVAAALESNWVAPLGPQVEAFEQEFAAAVEMPHAAALSSGTAALHLALLLCDVKPGDTVLCPTLTFVATANAIAYCGAIPVFIDAEARSWNIDPDLVLEELRHRARTGALPKAVIAVDLYGQVADMTRLQAACDEFGVALIEDAAEALGATYKGQAAGTFGRAAAFSFNGNKIITTSGGGMLVARDKDLVARARWLASQARDHAPHYEHSQVGYNYRLSNILAAIGRAQLMSLRERVEARRANFAFYQATLGDLPGVTFMPETPEGRSTRWLSCLTLAPEFGASHDEVRAALARDAIESRPIWKPMHLQPLFAGCEVRGGAVAEGIFRAGLCLPSGSNLSAEDRARVAAIVRGCCSTPQGTSL